MKTNFHEPDFKGFLIQEAKKWENFSLDKEMFLYIFHNDTHQATASLYTKPIVALLTISKQRSAPSIL